MDVDFAAAEGMHLVFICPAARRATDHRPVRPVTHHYPERMLLLKRIDTVEVKKLTEGELEYMLTKDPNARRWEYKLVVYGLRSRELSKNAMNWVLRSTEGTWNLTAGALIASSDNPMFLGLWEDTMTYHWFYKRAVYATQDSELTADDVKALVNEASNRRRLQLSKAHALQAMSDELDAPKRRERISQDVKVAVWQRDGGRCVECDSKTDLEFDHIIPLAMGGSNAARNLQLLCGPCNRRKGATLG